MYDVSLGASCFPAQADEPLRDTTVGGILIEAAAEAPGALALLEVRADGSRGRQWTYRELLADAERLADALLSRYEPGERVAIWSPNSPEWVIVQFAAGLAGLTLVTVNPAYQRKELAYVLEQSRSVGLFLVREWRGNAMAEIARDVSASLEAIREVVDLDDPAALFARSSPSRPRPVVRPNDPVQVQYTSGTTGFPKGAVLSHRGLTNNARFWLSRMGPRAGDIYLNVMPLFHTAGCSIGVLGCVQWRCQIVLARLFEPNHILSVIERERVDLFIGVPTMLIAMLEAYGHQPRNIDTLRAVLSGGTGVPPEVAVRIEQTFGCAFVILYGQTESSGGLALTRVDDPIEERMHSIGQPFPHTELSIRDAASDVVPLGVVGEICARGYCVMLGYNDNPEATERAIDKDGWLHTGDLGVMDANGFVRMAGRLKDLIIRGGENLFPAEIENVLAMHPSVAEVAVVGVPDPQWGEIAVAFLRPRVDATLDAIDLVRHVRSELAAPKTPAHWVVLDALPLTGSGKVQKFVLRERWLAGDYSAHLLPARGGA
ncbi:AMP-binding protein [Dyella amyloliquefaciens]|uniref:AMP-binding protein n=1 Tax=Dyella amyloliquefaciens TaxID=1770545 RepID=UPI00102EC5B9|nr:AMP-binding protein [Dyella amyloliquefaciens]